MKRLISITLAVLLVTTLLCSCGAPKPSTSETAPNAGSATPASTAPSSQESVKAIDTSKHVNLTLYLMNDPPADLSSILEKLNQLTERDLNASVDIVYTTSAADKKTKYNLMLTAGENVDLCYAANWMNFTTFATNGAFIPLDELLPTYAPGLWQNISKSTWDQCRINGKIMAVPKEFSGFHGMSFAWREDLRKKYNLPEINSIETIEQYMQKIKSETDLTPYGGDLGSFAQLMEAVLPYEFVESSGAQAYFAAYKPNGNPSELFSISETPEFAELMRTMKRWADAGYWSKSILSSQDPSVPIFNEGKSATIVHNQSTVKSLIDTNKGTHPDWEIDYIPLPLIGGQVHAMPAMQDAMAIPRSSKNPERALMLLEKLHNDKEYSMLTTFGIEGKHYNLSPNGNLDYTGIDFKTVGYSPEELKGWGWRNEKFYLTREGGVPLIDERTKQLQAAVVPDALVNYIFVPDKVQAEQAAINQVATQYGLPILTGLVNDVDAAIAEYNSKLDAAGLTKYIEEHSRQITEQTKAK